MKKSIYVIALITILFSACKNDKKQTESNSMDNMQSQKMDMKDDHNHDMSMSESSLKEEKNSDAATQKNSTTSAIIDSYLQIKNALVKDSKKGASEGGKMMLIAFEKFDMTKLTDAQHIEYMDIYEDAKEQAEHIIKSPIDHQREHFENLSVDINDLIVLLGTEKTLYQSKCPMAGEGKGAIWISEFKEIKNPFFGSKMISCGSVQKQIN